MADFILLTRVYENAHTGERETIPLLVNLDHVRAFRPKEQGGTWLQWAVTDVFDTEVAEEFDSIGHQFDIYFPLQAGRVGGPP